MHNYPNVNTKKQMGNWLHKSLRGSIFRLGIISAEPTMIEILLKWLSYP